LPLLIVQQRNLTEIGGLHHHVRTKAERGKAELGSKKSRARSTAVVARQHYQIPTLYLLSCPHFVIPSPIMPVFVRSVAPFVRTARSALHQGNSVSPWKTLGRQNGASILNGARTYAAVFERTKPHVNIGMQAK
jgi:hypothetical protein